MPSEISKLSSINVSGPEQDSPILILMREYESRYTGYTILAIVFDKGQRIIREQMSILLEVC